jgi:hypothetical protein
METSGLDHPVTLWRSRFGNIGYFTSARCDAKCRIMNVCLATDAATRDHLNATVVRLLALPYADHPDHDRAWPP